MVYATEGLIEVLLEMAREAEPESVDAGLAVSRAADLEGAETLDPETPVFSDFVFPDVGGSVNAVFGVDLGTPAGGTPGRFVSHPLGELEVTMADDLAEVILVAVPPWEPDDASIRAFDRRGRRQPLELLEAESPAESFDD